MVASTSALCRHPYGRVQSFGLRLEEGLCERRLMEGRARTQGFIAPLGLSLLFKGQLFLVKRSFPLHARCCH